MKVKSIDRFKPDRNTRRAVGKIADWPICSCCGERKPKVYQKGACRECLNEANRPVIKFIDLMRV